MRRVVDVIVVGVIIAALLFVPFQLWDGRFWDALDNVTSALVLVFLLLVRWGKIEVNWNDRVQHKQ